MKSVLSAAQLQVVSPACLNLVFLPSFYIQRYRDILTGNPHRVPCPGCLVNLLMLAEYTQKDFITATRINGWEDTVRALNHT